MFSAKDLGGFVCKAADAVGLKFGKRKAKVHFSLPLCCCHALSFHLVAMSLPPVRFYLMRYPFCRPPVVRKVKDLDDDKLLFRAAYTHQVFGEK